MLWEHILLRHCFTHVFFANGKNLCLCGGREHHTLKISQLVFGKEDKAGEVLEYVTYTEHGSKNRSGSYKDKHDNKVITHYGDKSLGERCYIFLLQTYLSRRPKCAFENDKFYWQPKQKTPLGDDSPWFAATPCGRNSLGGTMKQICADAKIPPKTNHTLRATGTSRMFAANVPEKIIQQQTGHRSLDGLRRYERTSLEQQRAVSLVLASSKLTDYASELCKAETSCKSETELSRSEKSKDPLDELNLQHYQNCTINITFNS